jgi:hypothetical protein
MKSLKMVDIELGDLIKCHCGCNSLLIVSEINITEELPYIVGKYLKSKDSKYNDEFFDDLTYYVDRDNHSVVSGNLTKVS